MSIVATAPTTAGLPRARLPLGPSTTLAALALSMALALPGSRTATDRVHPRVAPARRPTARWYHYTFI